MSYLAHSPLLPNEQRAQAEDLYQRLHQHVKPGQTPWLSLTGYELEPHSFGIVKRAIDSGSLLDMQYTDGAGSTRRRLVKPVKIYADEGIYNVALWTDVAKAAPEDKQDIVLKNAAINKANGKPRTWQVLHIARIEQAKIVEPTCKLDIPDMPLSELRKWSFDNGTATSFVTDAKDMPFTQNLPDATVEPCGKGEKVNLIVSSDSWFVAFCIAHARHLVAVGPETLRTMIIARAQRELSVVQRTED